jgi:uncharacterized membrane protein YqaE (UPF0057 family)
MTFIEVLFAVFLPPIAVLMRRGVSTQLLINIILTIIGWIPGVIHALWVLASNPKGAVTA